MPGSSSEPIPAPRKIAYGGRVLDGDGRPLSGLTPHLWGSTGEPSGQDGTFSIPLDPTDIPAIWRAKCLTFSSPGRQYPLVEPRPIGLHGKDEVWVTAQRGPRIKLWWLDSRTPVAGHAVTLCDRVGQPVRSGSTDADGMYAPFWEEHQYRTYLDVAIEGGSVRYVLDRSHVMVHHPLHLFVPRIDKALCLEIECRDGDGRPVAGARVQLGLFGGNGGILDYVTDARGRGTARFWLTDEEYDTSVAVVASWRAAWKTPGGVLRVAEKVLEKKRPSVRRSTPLPLVLDHGDIEECRGGFPVLVREAGTGAPVRPVTIFGTTKPGTERASLWGSWRETPRSTAIDPTGRVPRRVELMTEGEGSPWSDGETFRLRVGLADRPQVEKLLTMGEVRRAFGSSRPIVVTVPGLIYCARWIEVRGPDDAPLPFARLFVATRGAPRSVLCDDRGRAFMGRIPANDECRIVVVDGVTGAGGEIDGYRTATAPEVTTLRLEAPRVLRFRIRRESGAVPGGVSARLIDRTKGRAVAPPIQCRLLDDNLIVFPAAALGLYDVSVRSRNTKPVRVPATEVGEMLVLE